MHRIRSGLLVGMILCCSLPARAADWPMWRYDANRSDASPQELAAELHLAWVREYPPLTPAWDEPVNQDRMPFDRVYEPVVLGTTMFVGSSVDDRVVALDTRTGQQKWRFFADGPVRLPPVAWQDKLFVASDDGYLYCLDAGNGSVLWKFRGGPNDRKVLGNGRMISAWPARGGPVLHDGVVYFAAGIWPMMGVFIHALDAETGKVVWTNDGLGSTYVNQPHGGAVAFAGVAPQGSLAVVGDRLLVPGGRSVPACLDRHTGELLYFHLAGSKYHDIKGSVSGKLEGGSHVCGIGDYFFNHRQLNTSMYDLATGEMYLTWETTTYPVLAGDACYLSGNPVEGYSLKEPQSGEYELSAISQKTGVKKTVQKPCWQLEPLGKWKVDGRGALIAAGGRLYAGGENVVSALDVSASGSKPSWSAKVEGSVARLIAADDRLFAVTRQGRIHAFAPEKTPTPTTFPPVKVQTPAASEAARLAIGRAMPVAAGYCLAFGLDTGSMVQAVLGGSQLQVVAVEPDPEKVAQWRSRFDDAGLYGTRISVHPGDPKTFQAPAYVAAFSVCEDLAAAGLDRDVAALQNVYRSMRPYGGSALLAVQDETQRAALGRLIAQAELAGAKIGQSGPNVLLTREGPLPGAADWTHQYGDVANTAKSNDKLVKLPLGVLWFGGNSHQDILPRHGHGPSEQVVGGRLLIEGVNMLSARDVYTGEVLWKRTFPSLGTYGIYYDDSYIADPLSTAGNQEHIAGANARGTNYVATPDRVYLAAGSECLVLDPATGKTLATFSLPAEDDSRLKPAWGYIGVYEDLLIAGAAFVRYSQQLDAKKAFGGYDTSSSRRLVVMDRHTGKVLWTRRSKYGFRHNAIVAGAGKLFSIDNLPVPVIEAMKRRGETPDLVPVLTGLDLRTGRVVWSTTESVFGTWLGYSSEHDVLIQGARASRDMIEGEPSKQMVAYRGEDGTVLWDHSGEYGGPAMLHGKTIYFSASDKAAGAVGLLDGRPIVRRHPLTGETLPWQYQRRYGCNAVVASECLLTFRSGAAGFYDLVNDGGTGNLGGFKSGCTSNLIAADGVLNAPDYTRTCTCSYQNQTSLAMIHMPDMEVWTFNEMPARVKKSAPVLRLGLNFGAPGDRRDESGTLWLDCPSVGGPSPDVPVVIEPSKPDKTQKNVFAGRTFRHHAATIVEGSPAWVAASGLLGVTDIRITLAEATASPRSYMVRLYFAEPEPQAGAGDRVFDVALQGKPVLTDFDVAAEAGGPRRVVVRQFEQVAVADTLEISFTPKSGAPLICGVEVTQEPAGQAKP